MAKRRNFSAAFKAKVALEAWQALSVGMRSTAAKH